MTKKKVPSVSFSNCSAITPSRIALAAAVALVLAVSPASNAEGEPINALMVTGGGWHDYDVQKGILSEGIGARTNIEWTIDHEAGDDSAAKISRHENTDWAREFDVVVYNMCFSGVEDVEWIERIVDAHHETGTAAVVLHCAVHSYRWAEPAKWFELTGVTSFRHEAHRPFTVENLEPEHPIMRAFPESWRTPQGELYEIQEIGANTTPLAQAYGQDTERHHVTVWTHRYGNARVFGTTIGHHNETMAAGEYLDLVTRGLLWTVEKLDDEGAPAPGYAANPNDKRLVLIAGRPSHGRGDHEHNAGVRLFADSLEHVPGIEVTAHYNGWPDDPEAFDEADGILLYMDGGGGHPVIQGERLRQIGDLMDRGVGIAAFHYAVEVPADRGGDEFLDWIGGFYETNFSVNPIWTAEFIDLPAHPITRGVEPFSIRDEWYFNIRFRPGMEDITPILQATPSDGTRDGPYVYPRGPYPHIVEEKGRTETMAWAVERDGGGRGFGFTGGHFHRNWGDDNFRKIALNALVWITGADVPEGGVESSVSEDYLERHLD